jgi:TRAP transporter TAXI family solute receptor
MRRFVGLMLVAVVMACGIAARADETELDPAKVSQSLKAIFQLGSTTTKQALNANTVTLISGTIGGTYVQFGADLASVLDDGNKLRMLPIVGRGSVQSVADILFLQGVDLGIVRADTLDYLEKKGFAKDIKKQFTYVTKLYNEEMHVIAARSVPNLKELDGKTVSVDLPNGGTFVTALTVFERLGMKPNVVYIEQRIALEKLKRGEIDAVIVVGGKPYKSVSGFKDDRFHLVTVNYDKPLQGDYLPATLTAADYPNLISKDEQTVDTIAVPAVLAAYNWAPNTDRYRKLTQFVDAFFTKFPTFQNPPFHPKWTEVSLAAPLAGWTRFPAAQQWLDSHGVQPIVRSRFDEFPKQNPAADNVKSEADRDALFKQFQAWQADQGANDTSNARAQLRNDQKLR